MSIALSQHKIDLLNTSYTSKYNGDHNASSILYELPRGDAEKHEISVKLERTVFELIIKENVTKVYITVQ